MRVAGLKPVHWGQILSVAAPVATMIGMHVSWMPRRDQKARMLMKHTGFWGGMTGTVLLGHRYGMWYYGKKQPVMSALTFLVGATLPILGYLGMKKLSKKLFPAPDYETELHTSIPSSASAIIPRASAAMDLSMPSHNIDYHPQRVKWVQANQSTPNNTSNPLAVKPTAYPTQRTGPVTMSAPNPYVTPMQQTVRPSVWSSVAQSQAVNGCPPCASQAAYWNMPHWNLPSLNSWTA